jgi:predicted alpha/beta superfamily hydrolase
MKHISVRAFSLAILLLNICLPLFAQSTAPAEGTPITLGTALTITSKVYGEQRLLQVSPPASYAQDQGRYPVLYLTDGPAHLAHTRGTVDFLVRNGLMPDLIIVAIATPNRNRDLAPGGPFGSVATEKKGSDRFVDFLEQEVIPFVESRYRTAPYRIFSGTSFGGLLALQLLVQRPEQFQAFIAASPTPGWDNQVLKTRIEAYFKAEGRLPHSLFVTMGNEEEGDARPNRFDTLCTALSGIQARGFTWGSMHLAGEEHATVMLLSNYWGLKHIFAGWRPPQDRFTQQYTGTPAEYKAHFAGLSKRMGYPVLPLEAKLNQIGYGFLRQQRMAEGVEMFRLEVECYPRSANAYDSLGEAYMAEGNTVAALKSIERCLELEPGHVHATAMLKQLRGR